MIKNDTNNFFNDKETQDPLIREKLLFKDIGLKLKKITENSVGWKNRLNKINFEKINTREDFNNIPITRKTSLIEMQKFNFPYAGFNIKDTKEYAYMFASPGPIYEPAFTFRTEKLMTHTTRAPRVSGNPVVVTKLVYFPGTHT